MMVLLFGNHRNLIGKGYCFDKVLELEDAFKPFDSIHFLDLPFRHLWVQFNNFGIG